MKMSGDGGVNAHKKMAMGGGGDFGIGSFPGNAGDHPDAGMSHAPMDDSQRNGAVGSNQGAPDHGIGKGHPDHFNRSGKA